MQGDYYPFGMLMPERQFSHGTHYRYGFNGQELSNEVKSDGYSYSAQSWEYDSRSGRRWNVDPRTSSEISSYACFNANPIIFKDVNGDKPKTLDLPTKTEANIVTSINDIESMVKAKYQSMIVVDDKRRVSLSETKQDIKKACLNDAGLSLLLDLIGSSNSYYYSVSCTSPQTSTDLNGVNPPTSTLSGLDRTKYPLGYIISYDATKIILKDVAGTPVGEVSDIQTATSNLSRTLRCDEALYENVQNVPSRTFTAADGTYKPYDGLVRIASGEFYKMNSATKVTVPRAAIIYHELYENFFRTEFGGCYAAAHSRTVEMEKIFTNYSNN